MDHSLSKKEQTLLGLENAPKALFQCIHCQKELQLALDGSLKCSNNHTFNLAKQGYYFLSKVSGDESYSRELFQARRRIINESPFYIPLHEVLRPLLKDATVILDAGSGEGSHLAHLIGEGQYGLAFDLSKSGVQLATDYNDRQFNAVADLTNLPLQDGSVDVVLSLLSPSNYEEFNRVGRRVVKVIPNSGYLREIRGVMQQKGWLEAKSYSNEEVLAIFKRHYPNCKVIEVNETAPLTHDQLKDLVAMTPLTWQLTKEQSELLLEELVKESKMTLDVSILISE